MNELVWATEAHAFARDLIARMIPAAADVTLTKNEAQLFAQLTEYAHKDALWSWEQLRMVIDTARALETSGRRPQIAVCVNQFGCAFVGDMANFKTGILMNTVVNLGLSESRALDAFCFYFGRDRGTSPEAIHGIVMTGRLDLLLALDPAA